MTTDSARPAARPPVDAVVVSYNSSATLRACVEPLCAIGGVHVTVVDNDSPDDALATIADLPVDVVASGRNGGFAFGCNVGTARGSAPYVLLLNPDAQIERPALQTLVDVLEREPGVGLVGPRIVDERGEVHPSQRRFPRLRSTWAQALFLHRVAPRAPWTDELVRDPDAYAAPRTVEWLSGACMLVRRSALEATGGLDERFFLYCEDTDLCRRLAGIGLEVRYDPAATIRHLGGRSAPRSTTLPMLARSRVAYARKHHGRLVVALEAAGIAAGAATHAVVSASRPGLSRAHLRALRAAVTPRPRTGTSQP